MEKLTERQKRFIDYYVETGNATKAAKRAGYKQPHVQGAQNLEKLRILIDARISEKDAERIAKQDEVLQFLTSVLRGEVKEEIPLGIGTGEQMLAKKDTSIKDRVKAAELLGKRYGMWVDNTNLTGDIGVTIIDDIGSEPDETG